MGYVFCLSSSPSSSLRLPILVRVEELEIMGKLTNFSIEGKGSGFDFGFCFSKLAQCKIKHVTTRKFYFELGEYVLLILNKSRSHLLYPSQESKISWRE